MFLNRFSDIGHVWSQYGLQNDIDRVARAKQHIPKPSQADMLTGDGDSSLRRCDPLIILSVDISGKIDLVRNYVIIT